ncbi:MAG: hypothetical protein GY797_34735 [Deltaproteobacteria bacterium]|nr:hypothetical protein [Deltaproteobacteria bacterium]
MKNTYFLIIALLVGVCINPLPGFCSDQPPKVRKMHWGMTPEEVQKQEKGETAGKTLLYHVEFAEFPTIVEYVFTENRLVEITFYSRYKKERYQEDLKTLVAHLSKMYGEPVKKNRWAAEQTLIILSKIKAGWMLRFIYKEEQS